MKKVLVMAAIAGMALSVHADLWWFNGVAISNQSGVALTAHNTDSSIGCFAQLIYTGGNGQADPFAISGKGTSGDDVVVATMFCGQNDSYYMDGYFPYQSTAAIVGSTLNGDYYVRVYNAANLSFNLGTNAPIPTGATYYWQSTEHTYTHNAQQPDNWDFAPNGGQTTILIPEPAVFGLSIIGLISLRLFARKRK